MLTIRATPKIRENPMESKANMLPRIKPVIRISIRPQIKKEFKSSRS
jgi:hypothetical protein